jgi:hypothetical protein
MTTTKINPQTVAEMLKEANRDLERRASEQRPETVSEIVDRVSRRSSTHREIIRPIAPNSAAMKLSECHAG